jgi:glutamate synthase domain-containing protein 2
VGIATQKPDLRSRLLVDESAERLKNYFEATVELMKILARACGHSHLDQFCMNDLTTWDRDIAYMTGVSYAGVTPL